MKQNKTEYIVVNAFSEISEAERKEKINRAIRTLCVIDIEKSYELDYNIGVAFHGSGFDQTCVINPVLPHAKKSYP